MTEAEREIEHARAAELSALELVDTAIKRVRFLEQRLDDVVAELDAALELLRAALDQPDDGLGEVGSMYEALEQAARAILAGHT